jgi:hypothetical protein
MKKIHLVMILLMMIFMAGCENNNTLIIKNADVNEVFDFLAQGTNAYYINKSQGILLFDFGSNTFQGSTNTYGTVNTYGTANTYGNTTSYSGTSYLQATTYKNPDIMVAYGGKVMMRQYGSDVQVLFSWWSSGLNISPYYSAPFQTLISAINSKYTTEASYSSNTKDFNFSLKADYIPITFTTDGNNIMGSSLGLGLGVSKQMNDSIDIGGDLYLFNSSAGDLSPTISSTFFGVNGSYYFSRYEDINYRVGLGFLYGSHIYHEGGGNGSAFKLYAGADMSLLNLDIVYMSLGWIDSETDSQINGTGIGIEVGKNF